MIRLVLILLFIFLALPGRGQFMEKSFSLKDDSQRSQQVNLYSDGSFKEVTGNILCECASYSVGYYNVVGDTLMIIHRPYFQDSLKAAFSLRTQTIQRDTDSTRINLSVFDIVNDERLISAFIIPSNWNPEDSSNMFFSDKNGEATFYVNLDSVTFLTVSDMAYDRIRIDLPRATSQIEIQVALPLRYRWFHTYYNEEYRIQKFLIHDLQQKITLESIPSGYVLTELDSVSRN